MEWLKAEGERSWRRVQPFLWQISTATGVLSILLTLLLFLRESPGADEPLVEQAAAMGDAAAWESPHAAASDDDEPFSLPETASDSTPPTIDSRTRMLAPDEPPAELNQPHDIQQAAEETPADDEGFSLPDDVVQVQKEEPAAAAPAAPPANPKTAKSKPEEEHLFGADEEFHLEHKPGEIVPHAAEPRPMPVAPPAKPAPEKADAQPKTTVIVPGNAGPVKPAVKPEFDWNQRDDTADPPLPSKQPDETHEIKTGAATTVVAQPAAPANPAPAIQPPAAIQTPKVQPPAPSALPKLAQQPKGPVPAPIEPAPAPAPVPTKPTPSTPRIAPAPAPVPDEFAPPAAPRAAGGSLRLEIFAPPQVAVGSPVTLMFRVTNVGHTPVENVRLHDVLPAQLRHAQSQDLEYRAGRLNPGESRMAKIDAVATAVGEIANQAQGTASGGAVTEAVVRLRVTDRGTATGCVPPEWAVTRCACFSW